MKNKLNLISNLVLLLTLDATLMVLFYKYTQQGYNQTDTVVAGFAFVIGLFFVRDTYKLLKPEVQAFVAPKVVESEWNEEGEEEDGCYYEDRHEEYAHDTQGM